MPALEPEQIIPLKNGESVKVIKLLGKGGQGEVYSVEWNGSSYALKWYTNKSVLSDEKFFHNLERLKKETEVNKVHQAVLNDYFTLPIELTDFIDNQYGFVMSLIDTQKMVPLYSILYGKRSFKDTQTLITACSNLSEAFTQLQLSDLTFTDINENGLFFDCDSGKIMICDCDNITTGEYSKAIGVPGLIAPELLNDPEMKPSELTDLHSLAVIIFEMLFGTHPYQGSNFYSLTLEEQNEYYKQPIFIFSSKGYSADESLRMRWDTLPKTLKNKFHDSLELGVDNPQMRTGAETWYGTLRSVIERMSYDPMWSIEPPKMPKRLQRIIFIIDTSTSMSGDKINNINLGLEKAAKECNNLIENGTIYDTDVSFSIMTFDESAKWLCNDLSVAEYCNNPITIQLGERSTWTGKAFMKLDEYLDISDYSKKFNGYILRYPLIVLITDGKSRRYSDYLEELKNNICFQKSNKVALGLKDNKSEPSEKMLFEFVQNSELYCITDKINIHLAKLIKQLSVSQSRYKGQGENPVLSVMREARAVTGD